MKTQIKYLTQYYLSLMLVLCTSFINAQKTNSFDLLVTGNTSEYHNDDKLLKKWQKASHDSENLAFLMLGNIYNIEESNFLKEIFLGKRNPLLLTPGEKEWANGSASGKEMIKNISNRLQEQYLGSVYLPDAACPGPKEVILNEHLVVILIDTHWWVHKHDRRFNKCGIETSDDVLILIEDAIRRHYHTKHVVIAGHHALKSFGNSDGYFSTQQNILEAPYVLYRKMLGSRRDNHHPDFKGFRDAMLSIIKKFPDIVYISAGDANLQYFSLDNSHHIISGSMVESEFVRTKKTEFGTAENGFAQLSFTPIGECELTFIGLNGELFRKIIYKRQFVGNDIQNNIIVQLPDSITIEASKKYNISKKRRIWMGENYRDIWITPIKVPVFNINTKLGGLNIIKRGGGKQTLSLRLGDKNGRQYVLRSLEKNLDSFLPPGLKNSYASDFAQDQISTSNPYAALVVAKLAEYAGIYHTNPEIVYVPDDPNLGIYQKDVAGQLFIFEERPSKNRSDVASFGNSDNIISTDTMLEKIIDDENHFVDSYAYLRARLFDTLINDWDRHYDQWRWASFRNGKKTVYKPIPRDRDQAFLVTEGVISWITTQKPILPGFQNFDEYTEYVEGLAFNARYLDRTILIHNEWSDWLQQIDSLKALLTDERINKAVLEFPKEIQPLHSDRTGQILKARLNNLEPMGRTLYSFLSKEVSITGTNKRDLFEIFVPNDSTIKIIGHHLNKNNQKGTEIFSRKFYASETKKLRIYGLDKKDRFLIQGNAKNNISLYIIGGDDKDEVIYESTMVPRYLSIYDSKKTKLSPSVNNRIINNYDEKELKYDREAFKYNITYPNLFMGYNKDDGIFWGGGAVINKFSRYYRQRYEILTNYAFLTESFNFHFAAKNVFPLKHIEWNLIAEIKSPNFANNYFGMGNETKWQVGKSNSEYYSLRLKEYYIKTGIKKVLGEGNIHKTGLDLFYKNTTVEQTPNRFITEFSQNNLSQESLSPSSFAGISLNYNLDTSPQETKKEEEFGGSSMLRIRGLQLDTKIIHFVGLNENSHNFTKILGEAKSYLSFSKRPRVVYALKFGGEKLIGDYVFTEAAKLGQKENLRGFRHTRFYGDGSLYLNTEIRIRVKQFKTYFLNGTTGLFLFNDVGRVWLEKENSSLWHDGYGVGLWWSFFEMALFTISYAKSEEDNLVNFAFNFQF